LLITLNLFQITRNRVEIASPPLGANLVGVWACCGGGDRKSRRDAMIIDKRRKNRQNPEGVTENNATPSELKNKKHHDKQFKQLLFTIILSKTK
jgi:hypothetical protein